MKAMHKIESILFSTILIAILKEAYFEEISWFGNVDLTKPHFCKRRDCYAKIQV